jgi:hypothetical protein
MLLICRVSCFVLCRRYTPVLSSEPVMRASAFIDWDGTPVQQKTVTLRPEGMPLLSEAPAEELTERQIKYQNNIKLMEKPDDEEKAAAKKRQALLDDGDDYTPGGRWDARPAKKNEVNDDEWGDDVSD